MSYHDWEGTQTARRALQRIVEGRPMFAAPARRPQQLEARRRAVAYLYDEGYIERGANGPVATALGRDEFERKPAGNQYTDAQINLIVSCYAELGARVIARRLGRPFSGIAYQARKLGVASRAACQRRQRAATYSADVTDI